MDNALNIVQRSDQALAMIVVDEHRGNSSRARQFVDRLLATHPGHDPRVARIRFHEARQ